MNITTHPTHPWTKPLSALTQFHSMTHFTRSKRREKKSVNPPNYYSPASDFQTPKTTIHFRFHHVHQLNSTLTRPLSLLQVHPPSVEISLLYILPSPTITQHFSFWLLTDLRCCPLPRLGTGLQPFHVQLLETWVEITLLGLQAEQVDFLKSNWKLPFKID